MTVPQYIADQPSPVREIMTVLRMWVLDLGPHAQEKISYKIPFFEFYGNLCYLNPLADGVDLGFVHGNQLGDEEKVLESKGRKQVKSISFFSLAALEEREEAVRRLLNEAAIVNEYHTKLKKKKK